MDNKVKLVNVYVEKDGITCECVCALHDVTEGDYVQIFLNNAPTTGVVKELKEVNINEMTNSMYDMKSVIRKMPNPKVTENMPRTTISVGQIINRNRLITVLGRGVIGKLNFTNAEVESYKAEVGDIMYFSEYDGTKFRTIILNIEESSSVAESVLHIDAIKKDDVAKTFLSKNQIVIDVNSKDKSATLKMFAINEEEYTVGDYISHIGSKAFERARKLKKLILATMGVTIEPMAFSYNNSIEEIYILDERATISVNCFDGCRNLKKVVLPYELYYMRFELEEYYSGRIEFSYNLGRDHLLNGIVYTEDFKAIVCCVDDEIEEYEAPLSVSGILPYAFKNCRKLKYFKGSPFMKEAGFGIFAGCMELKEVHYRFENNSDVVYLFGEEYCDDGIAETIEYTDGSSRVFYMPKKCKYFNMPTVEDVLKDVEPRNVDPAICHFIAEYYSSVHKTKEAVKFHSVAAIQGYSKSYQKLAEYSQIEDLGRQYFTVDLYDYANRVLMIKPFFLMLSQDYPEYRFEYVRDEEILDKFLDKENLIELLQKIVSCKIYDTDLLNVGLNKLFVHTEDIHDGEIKRLFLRCANKIGLFDNVLYWKDELLEEVFETEADYREFAFEIVKLHEFIQRPEKDKFISEMPECETKESLSKAYYASNNYGPENVAIFEEFLEKAKKTNDDFYQKCALVAIHSYLAYCWREKERIAEFRKLLDLVLQRYEEGHDVLGLLVLSYKQNLKKSIPKRFYMECAEKLYDRGILYSNIFDNLLGKNEQEKAAFFCKYPEFYDLQDRESLVMKEVNDRYFYIKGTMLQKPVNAKTTPLLYLHFVPELIGGELILFLNPHEAVTFLQKRGDAIPDEFFRISMGQVLSIMLSYELNNARLLPRTINKELTREYIEHMYDWR